MDIDLCVRISLKDKSFSDYHLLYLAKFLSENQFIVVEETDDLESIKRKVIDSFETSDPLEKINAELSEVQSFRNSKQIKELPAFRVNAK